MTLMPGIEYQGQIKMHKSAMRGPDSLALGPGSTLYAVDGLNNRVLKFDGNGNYLDSISIAQVSAVAAASDGALYIGSHRNYSVAIFRNGNITGYLGQGEKEFSSIRDIAVDADTGTIYVVDNLANSVKVYNSAGKKLRTLKGLYLPVGVVVVNREVYVVDVPVMTDDSGAVISRARISVFDGAGKLVNSFFGASAGQTGLLRPSGIAVSQDGIIFVSDALQNSLFAYDAAGQLVGQITGTTDEFSGAVDVALSTDGTLYLAAGHTHSIEVFSSVSGGQNNSTGAGDNSGSLR